MGTNRKMNLKYKRPLKKKSAIKPELQKQALEFVVIADSFFKTKWFRIAKRQKIKRLMKNYLYGTVQGK